MKSDGKWDFQWLTMMQTTQSWEKLLQIQFTVQSCLAELRHNILFVSLYLLINMVTIIDTKLLTIAPQLNQRTSTVDHGRRALSHLVKRIIVYLADSRDCGEDRMRRWVQSVSRVVRDGTIYQPLRSGRIWHKVNF